MPSNAASPLCVSRSDDGRVVRLAVVVILAVVAGYNLERAAEWSMSTRKRGLGYASRTWRRSPTIAALRTFPRETMIYSNAPDVIYVLAKRDAQPVPRTRRVPKPKSRPVKL